MNYEQIQVHLVKTVVHLKKVSITVRFPCSISFALKHQNNMIDHKGVYQLVKGQSIINQSIEIDVEVPYVRGRYEEKKLSLLIFMVSANGKIPAGTVTLNPTEKVIIDKRVPLEKCPDKNAEVVFTETYQKIQISKQTIDIKKSRVSLAGSNVSGLNYNNPSHYASSSVLHKRQQEQQSKKNDDQVKKNQTDYSLYRNSNEKSLRSSQVGSEGEKRSYPKFTKNRFQQGPKRNFYGTSQKDISQMRFSRASNQVNEGLQWQTESQNSRILKLQQEKTGYIKQIAKLRGSLVRGESEERMNIQGQFHRIKTEKSQLQEQVEKLKEKNKIQEKRDRQSGSMLKQLRDQLDKKKSRIIQLDSSKHQIQGQLAEKDRIINTLQSEKRKLQQSLQQQKALQQSFQKRLDLKENSYKEQIKKISDKYSQSEAERQKAMLDYNNILLQIENAQKRNQTILRQKEKLSNQQKSKLNKQIQQLLTEITDLQEKLSDKMNIVRQLQYSKKKAEQQEKEKIYKWQELKEKYDDLMLENKNLKEEKKSIQVELKSLQNVFNEDKVNYKKRYMDTTNELTNLKQKLEKSLIGNNQLQSRIKDLQLKIEKQVKQKNSINNKFEDLRRAQQRYLEDEQARQKLAQTLSMENVTQNNKLNQFKIRLQSERKKYETMQIKYQQQVQYLVKSKDYLQSEIEQLKWLLEQANMKFQTLNAKNRELNDQIIDLNHKIIQSEEKITSFEEERSQYCSQISILQMQVKELQNRLKTITDNYKRKEEEFTLVQKKGVNYEQELFILQNNHQHAIKQLKEKIEYYQKTIETKNKLIKQKDQQLILTNQELSSVKASEAKAKSEINHQFNEISTLKQLNKAIKQDFDSILAKNEKNRAELAQLQEKMQELENKIVMKNQQSQDLKKLWQKEKQQFKEYRQTNKRVLNQLFSFFCKQQYSENKKQYVNIQLLPDSQLSKLQSQCTAKVYNNNIKQQETNKNLAQTIIYLEQNISKLKTEIQALNQAHQKKLKEEFKSQKVLKIQQTQEISNLNEKIIELSNLCDQKSAQIQFLNSSASKYEDMITEFTEESIRMRQKEAELKTHISELQDQLQQLKEKELKNKLMASTQSQEIKHLFKQQKQRHEEIEKELRETIKIKERLLNERIQQGKKWALVESQIKLKETKLLEEISQLSQKLSNQASLRKNSEKNILDKQRTIFHLQQQLSNLKQTIQSLRSRQKHNQQQIKKSNAQIHSLELKFKSFEQQQSSKLAILQQSQRRERQKRQKLQTLKGKLESQNKEIRQKSVKLESQVEFYKFYKEQSNKKLSQYEKMKEDAFIQMIKCRETMAKSQKELGTYQNKHYKLEMEIEHLSNEKQMLSEANNKMKQRLEELEQKQHSLNQTLDELQSRNRQIIRLQEALKSTKLQNDKMVMQLNNGLAKQREQTNEKLQKIKELQKKLEDKNADINIEREKIQTQFENQKNMYLIKLQTYQQNMRVLQEEMQFQKQQATRQIQGANSIIQELNQVIRQKEETLQYRQEIINQQNVRLEQLNLQIVECVNKWQKEKEIYMPASSRITEINDELIRMNKFISQLDGRNKQLLEVNKRKMQQTLQNKPSVTEILKQFYIIMQKSKNKILNRCQTEKQKETVMLEFKAVQQKLDLTLKSTQIVTIKQ